jgi:hypothetical protein
MVDKIDLRENNIAAGVVRLSEAQVTNEGSPFVLVTYTVRETLNATAALFDQLRGRFVDSMPVTDDEKQYLEEHLVSALAD